MSYTTKLDAYLRSTNTSKAGDASKSLILDSAKLGNSPFGEDDHHHNHNHSRQYYQSAAADWSHNISVVHPTEKSKKETSSFFSTNENPKKEHQNDDSFTCKPQLQVAITKGIRDKPKLDTFGIADMSIQGHIHQIEENNQDISPFQQEKIIQSLLHKLVNIASEQNNRTSGIKDTASSETKPSHYDLNQFRPKKLITQFSQQSPGSSLKSISGVESQDYNLESFLPQKRFLKLSRESTLPSNYKNELEELAAAVVKQLKEQNLLLSCDFQQSQAISSKQSSNQSQQFADSLMKSKRQRLSSVTLPNISIILKNPVRIVSEAQTQTCEELKQSKIQPSQHQIFLMQQQYHQQQMQARMMNQQAGGGGWNNHGSRRSSTNTNNQNTLQQHPGFEYELESELLSEEILHSHGNTPGAMFSAQAFHQNQLSQNQQVYMNRPPTYHTQQNYPQTDEQKLLFQRQKLQQLEIERRLLDEEFMKKQATRHMAGENEEEGEFDTILRLDQIPFPNISLSRKDSFAAGSNYKSEHLCPENSLAHLSASQSSQQCNHSVTQSGNSQNLMGRANMQQRQQQLIQNNQNSSFHDIPRKQQPQLQHLQDEQYQDYPSESNYHEDENYNQIDYGSQFCKENNSKEESAGQQGQFEDHQGDYEERDEHFEQEEEGEWSDQKYSIDHRNEKQLNYRQDQDNSNNVARDKQNLFDFNKQARSLNFQKKISNQINEKDENEHTNDELLMQNQKLLINGTNQSSSSFNFSGKQSFHGTLNGTGKISLGGTGKISLGGTGENFAYFKTFGQAGKGTSSTVKSKETAAIMFTQQSESNNSLKLSAAQFERKLLLIQAFFRYCWIYKREQFKTAFRSSLVRSSNYENDQIKGQFQNIESQEKEEGDVVEEFKTENDALDDGKNQNHSKNTQNQPEIPTKNTNNNFEMYSNNNISSRSNNNNAQTTSSRMRTLQQGNNFGESRLSYALTASPISTENSQRSEKQLSSRNLQPITTKIQTEVILTESFERRNIPKQPERELPARDNIVNKDKPSPSRLSENKHNLQSSSQGFRSQYPQESFLLPFTHIKNLKLLVETALCS